MPKLIAVVLLLVLGAARADAGPDRVLLADPDPELLHAVEASLAPWRFAIVVDAKAPSDDAAARQRAAITEARFVVWRQGKELVVFDRDRAATERRPVRAGAFDPVSAAAAALTVKTMMRLPPPPPDDTTPNGSSVTSPAAPPIERDSHVEVRIEGGLGARFVTGDGPAMAGRWLVGVMVRPSSSMGWRFGARADFGVAETSVDQAGFKGGWSDWAVLAVLSWTYGWSYWELEPYLAAGFVRSTLDGTEMSTTRTETDARATIRGGTVLRRRSGPLVPGIGLELIGTPGAPSYVRMTQGMGAPEVFEGSSFSVVINAHVTFDLGR